MRNTLIYTATMLVALFSASNASAQDSRQAAYEQSIDFVKCKCVEVIYGITLNCENDPATARVEQYTSRHPRTGSLIGEIEALKKKQVESWTTDSIAGLLSTDIFHADNRSTYPQSYNFSVNRNRHTDGTMAALQTAVTQFVQHHVPALPAPQDMAILTDSLADAELPPALVPDASLTNEEANTGSGGQASPSFFSFHFNIAHVLLAALAVLVSWLLINRMRREYEEQINDLKFRIDGKADADELTKVTGEINHFTQKLEAARKKRLADKPPATAMPRPLSVEKALYLPAPDAGGSFRVADASDRFRPGVSVYKLKIDPANPDLATFTFHADNVGLQHAFGQPDTYIRPVCQEANQPYPGAKYVATSMPGVATRNGNIWMVDANQKALIRYE